MKLEVYIEKFMKYIMPLKIVSSDDSYMQSLRFIDRSESSELLPWYKILILHGTLPPWRDNRVETEQIMICLSQWYDEICKHSDVFASL